MWQKPLRDLDVMGDERDYKIAREIFCRLARLPCQRPDCPFYCFAAPPTVQQKKALHQWVQDLIEYAEWSARLTREGLRNDKIDL